MSSLKDAFTSACKYRDTLEKQSSTMLKEMFVIAKERKSIEDRRNVVKRQIAELNQLMTDVNGDRFSAPHTSKRWTTKSDGIYFVFINKKKTTVTLNLLSVLFRLVYNFLLVSGFFASFIRNEIYTVCFAQFGPERFLFIVFILAMNTQRKMLYKRSYGKLFLAVIISTFMREFTCRILTKWHQFQVRLWPWTMLETWTEFDNRNLILFVMRRTQLTNGTRSDANGSQHYSEAIRKRASNGSNSIHNWRILSGVRECWTRNSKSGRRHWACQLQSVNNYWATKK